MHEQTIEKPKERGPLRKLAGREYFIAKRRWEWLARSREYASTLQKTPLDESIFRHRSFLLRPLKNVEMYLQHNKVTNLRLALERINGIVIKPGETFSIWRLVGRPTKRRGFLDGLVLHNGKIDKGIGGGLCQLGNLLYWMALHTPLTIAERWRHGFDVFPDINRNIPFACGATLSYNYVDLQLKNETRNDFQINLWLDDEFLNGEIRSNRPGDFEYEIIETDHLIRMQWWGGYTRHNRIWQRRVSKKDGTTGEVLVTENHAIMMYNPLLESGSK
jgi:vancomycin resistance protein VanW